MGWRWLPLATPFRHCSTLRRGFVVMFAIVEFGRRKYIFIFIKMHKVKIFTLHLFLF